MRNTVRSVSLVIALLVALGLVPVMGATGPVSADPADGTWVITVNYSDRTIHTVDTDTDTVYGPFLAGQLGMAGVLADVAVTPDGTIAVVSGYDEQDVYFVDVSDPTSPSFLGEIDLSGIPLAPMDIAITPDGKFALITDGGGIVTPVMASVDIASRTVVDTKNVSDAEAVAVAPGGTVIVLRTGTSPSLDTFTIDGNGSLTAGSSFTTCMRYGYNFAVAPDGQTVVVCNWDGTGAVTTYLVTGPATLAYGNTVYGLPGAQQSVAFDALGTKAYVVSTNATDQLSVLDITAPGTASLNTAGAANLLTNVNGVFIGSDCIAVIDGVAYVGNPSSAGVPSSNLARVDLSTFAVTPLAVGHYPSAVAAFSPEPGELVAVGGEAHPVSVSGVLTPWIGLLGLLGVGVGFYTWRCRKADS